MHFQNLGKLLLMMSLLWAYFVFDERLTTWYGNDGEITVMLGHPEGIVRAALLDDGGVQLRHPVPILAVKKLRTITGCVIASSGVLIGMWLERFLIVVPSLGHKYLPYSWGTYRPRPVEILITTATFAAMALLYTLFSKFVPIISIWELKVGEHPAGPVARDRSSRPRSWRPTHERGLRAVAAPESAQRAVNGLRATGVADSEITVITAEPMEDFEFSERDEATWLTGSPGAAASGASPSPRGSQR